MVDDYKRQKRGEMTDEERVSLKGIISKYEKSLKEGMEGSFTGGFTSPGQIVLYYDKQLKKWGVDDYNINVVKKELKVVKKPVRKKPVEVLPKKKVSGYAQQKKITANRIVFEKKLVVQSKPPEKYWRNPSDLILSPQHSWDKMYVGKDEVSKADQRKYSKWLYSNVLRKNWDKLYKLETKYDKHGKIRVEADLEAETLLSKGKWKEAEVLMDNVLKSSIRQQNISIGYADSIRKSVGEQRLFMEMERRGLLYVPGYYSWKPPRDITDKSIKWAKKEMSKK